MPFSWEISRLFSNCCGLESSFRLVRSPHVCLCCTVPCLQPSMRRRGVGQRSTRKATSFFVSPRVESRKTLYLPLSARPRLRRRQTRKGLWSGAPAKADGRAGLSIRVAACWTSTVPAAGPLSWVLGSSGSTWHTGCRKTNRQTDRQTDWIVDVDRVWLGFVFDNTRPARRRSCRCSRVTLKLVMPSPAAQSGFDLRQTSKRLSG